MNKIKFSKYHGLENDFIIIDQHFQKIRQATKKILVPIMCHRNTGIGADGVVFFNGVKDSFSMRLHNADGSEAEISGNGIRCLAQYIYQNRLTRARKFVISTSSADNLVEVISSRGIKQITRIRLDEPKYRCKKIPMKAKTDYFIDMPFKVSSGELIGTAVNVGNPHIIFFVDNFDFDWIEYGREVEKDKRFPENTNVEFAVIKSRKKVKHCSWERGVGVTRSSGTGAASTVAAGVITGLLGNQVTVIEPAGELEIEIPSLNDHILLTGPSCKVHEGVFYY